MANRHFGIKLNRVNIVRIANPITCTFIRIKNHRDCKLTIFLWNHHGISIFRSLVTWGHCHQYSCYRVSTLGYWFKAQ